MILNFIGSQILLGTVHRSLPKNKDKLPRSSVASLGSPSGCRRSCRRLLRLPWAPSPPGSAFPGLSSVGPGARPGSLQEAQPCAAFPAFLCWLNELQPQGSLDWGPFTSAKGTLNNSFQYHGQMLFFHVPCQRIQTKV